MGRWATRWVVRSSGSKRWAGESQRVIGRRGGLVALDPKRWAGDGKVGRRYPQVVIVAEPQKNRKGLIFLRVTCHMSHYEADSCPYKIPSRSPTANLSMQLN
jgi:hypothetical protein